MPPSALVVGCGSIGRRHARNLLDLGVNVTAVDPDADARGQFVDARGVALMADLDEAWGREPALAVIASPTDLHVAHAIEAAQHGCHLLIEKPLASRDDRLDELLALTSERQLITMVGCNMRFHPGPAEIKRLLRDNAVGQTLAARLHTGSHLPDWRPGTELPRSYSASAERGGGAILDCIHELDLACWFFGPGRLAGAATVGAETIGLEIEGIAELLVRHDTGMLSSIHLDLLQRDYQRTCEIIGTEGTLYWSFDRSEIQIRDGRDTRAIDLEAAWTVNQMYVDELAYFLACVAEGHPTFNSIPDARATLALALAARGRSEAPS
jgi:predicted dehydrogenase